MEPAAKKLVEQVGFSQPVRVENRIQEMQNAKFKMQTLNASTARGDGRDAGAATGR
jgi:predicted TPR repeat methyltransferase